VKPMRTQPFFKYATDKLPVDSDLHNAIALYLGMRLAKNKNMTLAEWAEAIDGLVTAMRLLPKSEKSRIKPQALPLVTDIIYMFHVAAHRGWNHVYFTREQDYDWGNISYYQDIYWQQTVKEHRQVLEEELYGTAGD